MQPALRALDYVKDAAKSYDAEENAGLAPFFSQKYDHHVSSRDRQNDSCGH